MYPGQTTIYLKNGQLNGLNEIKRKIERTGNKISISNLVSEAVEIMLQYYSDDIIRNYKKQKYLKK